MEQKRLLALEEKIKMAENKQKTFYVDRSKAKKIINYLEAQGSIYSGTFTSQDGGEVKIQPHEGKIEIMCNNCNKEILDELEDIIKN